MRIVEGLSALDELDLLGQHGDAIESRSAVLVGVFDGVHLGHQRLLHELLELASATSAVPTVVTFRNHPAELLHGRDIEWIVGLPHRLRLLRRAGVQRTLLLDFDDELRAMTASAFTERILVRGLRARGLLLGYDAAIGLDREGTPERMRELGDEHGIDVREGSVFEVDGKPVSSTAIRAAIRDGDLDLANRMLGRWPSILGEVVHGEGRGRTIGYPTANVSLTGTLPPPDGVYAVEVIHDGQVFAGVANLGGKPTFGSEARTLETHLFDFDGDLYGAQLEVAFVARIRGQQKFANSDELRAQIEADSEAAREIADG